MPGDHLRIGDVARRAGVNVQTLRYYERRGLLQEPRRAASGYREYAPETVGLLRFIKRAQDLGFTLNEIKQLTRRDARGRKRAAALALVEARIRDIDRKQAQLHAMRTALSRLVEDCACGAGSRGCPIIEALDNSGPTGMPVGSGQDGIEDESVRTG